MIEGMQSILRQREVQFGKMAPTQPSSETEEALKLFFDYIKASNEQILGVCVTIMDNQKILGSKLDEIEKQLQEMAKEE